MDAVGRRCEDTPHEVADSHSQARRARPEESTEMSCATLGKASQEVEEEEAKSLTGRGPAPRQGFVSVSDTIDWRGQRYARVGRIHLLRVYNNDVLYIGPHWYCSVFMFLIVIGTGVTYVFVFSAGLGVLHKALGCLVTVLSASTFLQCALSDPGILPPNANKGSKRDIEDFVQLLPSAGDRVCVACDILQPEGSLHCEFCKVCIRGHDHHCPWMSKCIGAQNLASFYTFLCTGISSLIYIVVASVV